MYKCSECGAEYEIKPEYCDCGNDSFEEVLVEQPKPVKKQDDIKEEIKIEVKKQINSQPQDIHYKNNVENNQKTYDYGRLKSFFDPISTIIFMCCIVLAAFLLFWNSKPEDSAKNDVNDAAVKEQVNVNIPDVDSFWDDTPVVVKIPQKTNAAPVSPEPNIVQLVEQVFNPQKQPSPSSHKSQASAPAKPVKVSQTPKAQTIKVQTVNKTSAQKAKTQNQSASQNKSSSAKTVVTQKSPNISTTDLTNRIKNSITYNNTSQNQSGTTVNSAHSNNTKTPVSQSSSQSQPSTKTTTPPAIRTNTTKSSNTQSTSQQQRQTPVIKTVDPAIAKQELANYKIGLRNTIGKKIDFARVVGDGECALSFSLDSSGRLLNRKFTKQSSNITLNDAVFAAMNSTTRYGVPPSAYKNETLNLKIQFYNGNFSISLN